MINLVYLKMMKNLLIAGYSGYDSVDKVQNFIESFLKIKLPTDEIIICYSGKETEINSYLTKLGIKQTRLHECSQSPYVSRFKWFSEVIDGEVYDKVVCADIRDVVFQSNPFTWMYNHQKRPLLVCDEGFKHQDEAWNRFAMQGAFPDWKDVMMNKNVFNVGVIGGDADDVRFMCKRVYDKCESISIWRHTYNGEQYDVVPDQVAYSILVNLEDSERRNQRLSNKHSWCVTMASVEHSTLEIEGFKGKICNPNGQEYCIVHQYDRYDVMLKGKDNENRGLLYNPESNKFTFDNDEFFKIMFESGKGKPLTSLGKIRGSFWTKGSKLSQS